MIRPLFVLSLALLPGCVALFACTEVGCSGTLTILVDGAIPEGATVEIVSGDVTETCAVDNEHGYGCAIAEDGGTITFATAMGQAPDEVTIVITPAEGTATEHTLSPEWGEPTYPNGEACDGTDGGCVSGEADLVL